MSDLHRIAVIPARGGSKRVPRKNIRNFHGVPLIQRPIQTLLSSGLFSQVVVSTDDDEIAEIATNAGAAVPFIRPAELADDYTPTVPVILHAIDWFENHGVAIGDVAVVYPSAAFTTTDDLENALSLLDSTGVDQVFSACEFEAPIQRARKVNDAGIATMEQPSHDLTRPHDLEPGFYDAGQFYWWPQRTAERLRRSELVTKAPYLMPRRRVQDFDTLGDWQMAEKLFSMFGDCGPS